MSDVPPKLSSWPPTGEVEMSYRVGKKCRLFWSTVENDPFPGQQRKWLQVGGVLPTGGGGIDDAQARIYFSPGSEEEAVVRVVLPEDAPFRASRKGLTPGRSKSFGSDANPVTEVLLLYALKTGERHHRERALESLRPQFWEVPTLGEQFALIEEISNSPLRFKAFVGDLIAKSASKVSGLHEWGLWEKVADDAAAYTRRFTQIGIGPEPSAPNNNDRFIQAVREATIESGGLPSQVHVRSKWENLGGIGSWTEVRKTLGFEWLPPERDLDKFLKQASRDIRGGG